MSEVNNKNNVTEQQYAQLVKLASKAAMTVAFILVVTKLYAWLVTDAGSLLASATDSLLDLFASVVSFIIVRYSLSPADKEHRFGHGKAENLAGMAQSTFVLGSASLLILHGVSLLTSPVEISNSNTGIGITVLAIALTLLLVAFQRYVVSKTGSVAISADSLHYKSDVLMNIGVIAALLLSQNQWHMADGIFTIAVGVYLAFGACQIIYLSIQQLMDRELPEEELVQIKEVILSHPEVLGVHDIRTRQSGATRFIQFHLELDDSLTLLHAHTISDQVEKKVNSLFENADVFIHQDPQSVVPQEKHASLHID